MYIGRKLLKVAATVTSLTLFGGKNAYGELLNFDYNGIRETAHQSSWLELYRLYEIARADGFYTQSKYRVTLNREYPSVEAYTKDLRSILFGDIKPKMSIKEFKFNSGKNKKDNGYKAIIRWEKKRLHLV